MKKGLIAGFILLLTVSGAYAKSCPKKATWNGIQYEVERCIVIK